MDRGPTVLEQPKSSFGKLLFETVVGSLIVTEPDARGVLDNRLRRAVEEHVDIPAIPDPELLAGHEESTVGTISEEQAAGAGGGGGAMFESILKTTCTLHGQCQNRDNAIIYEHLLW